MVPLSSDNVNDLYLSQGTINRFGTTGHPPQTGDVLTGAESGLKIQILSTNTNFLYPGVVAHTVIFSHTDNHRNVSFCH